MIDKPGIYQMSAEDYHADPCQSPSLSASIANRLLSQSPAHAFVAHPRLNPNYVPEESDRFDLGSAAHAMLLENDSSRITWIDAPDFRSGTARAAKIDARAHGRLPVLVKYQDVLHAMVRVANETIARSELAGLFGHGKPEQTLVWQDNGGIWCRARPDWLTNDYAMIAEYKTTTSAEPSFFTRQIGNLGYSLQNEFYRRGLAALGLHDNPVNVIIAQEVEPPYAVAFYTLSNGYIEIAQHAVERAIQTWQICTQSGLWPAYPNRITVVDPPAWESNAHLQRLEMEASA